MDIKPPGLSGDPPIDPKRETSEQEQIPLFHVIYDPEEIGKSGGKMSCHCAKKAQNWIQSQEVQLPTAECRRKLFANNIEDVNLDKGDHALQRMKERNITSDDIILVIRKGIAIEVCGDWETEPRMVILGYDKNSRPLHVVCAIQSERHWSLVTAYDPRSHAHKWDMAFRNRVCFCKEANVKAQAG